MSTTIWAYVDAGKQVGDPDHLKLFADREAADQWFARYDPEGVAFEYPVNPDQNPRLISQRLLWRSQLAGEPTFSRLHWIDWNWALLG